MAKRARKRRRDRISPDLSADVRGLKRSCDEIMRKRGCANGDTTVEVNWFALTRLIDYFKETRDAASRVIVARDALHQVFFGSDD